MEEKNIQDSWLAPESEKFRVESLKKLREPFKDGQISKLPKPTKAQTDAVKTNYRSGQRCVLCGTWHHPEVIHLDYVGHAALTDRLLSVDPLWTWEPMGLDESGNPALVKSGDQYGMWIRLTVCGLTRIGFGSAGTKTGGDALKEIIGDALRNAAMRFGAALDLWHKGDLNEDQDQPPKSDDKPPVVTDAERYQKLPSETKSIFDGLSTSKDMAPRYKYCAGLGWDTGKIHADLLKKSDAAREKAIKENFEGEA